MVSTCKVRLARLLNVQHLEPAKELGRAKEKAQTVVIDMGQPAKAGWRVIFRAFGKLFYPYFVDPISRCRAVPLLTVLLTCMFLEVSLTVKLASATAHLENQLVKRDQDMFWEAMFALIGLHVVLWPIIMCHAGSLVIVNLDWRRYLTRRVLKMYINKEQAFYRLSMQYGNVDNPDERIAQNIGSFTHLSLKLVLHFSRDLLKIIMHSYALAKISSTLFWTLIGFSTFYTLVSMGLFAGPLMRVTRRVLAIEATLRYVLVRLRENAESVAFFSGHAYELECAEKMLDCTIWAEYKKHFINVMYHVATAIFKMGLEILPMLIVAPMYFKGQVEFGSIHASQMHFHHVMTGMMDLGKELADIAKVGAESIRIQELWDALTKLEKEGRGEFDEKCSQTSTADSEGDESQSDEAESEDDEWDSFDPEKCAPCFDHIRTQEIYADSTDVRLELTHVTMLAPLGHIPLQHDLSFTLRSGESMLIEGASGCGKSSVLRTIAGLWVRGSGRIRRPTLTRCFFVPQYPYICLGSLRDNILYPKREGDEVPTDEAIRATLSSLRIGHLPDKHGMDEEVDLPKILSGGERQRLNLARLLLRTNVDLAILDEATSALDEENEARAYDMIRQRIGCYISVGHRPGLVACHTRRLTLVKNE